MKIGITVSRARGADGTLHPSAVEYVRAVERAGGEAVLLPNDAARVAELVAGVDGIVVSGGVDVDVALYGGRPQHSRSQAERYRPERDAFESVLLHATRVREVPTLCVCRGLQIANVAFGGTLVEDIRDELGAQHTIEHRYADDAGNERADYAPGHEVTALAHSALARLAGRARFATNSMHHQAVRALAPGLSVTARTDDGIVEAVEAAFPHPFFIGVQWHPEALEDAVGTRLFAGLLQAARERTQLAR